MKKIILGLASEISGGKGTVAKYIEKKYKSNSYRFSSILRDILNRLHLDQTRNNLQDTSDILRKTFGKNILAKVMLEDIKNDKNKIIVIDGIRRIEDIEYIKSLPEFKLVYINTDIKTRYKRILNRNENLDDRTKTFEQFKKDNNSKSDITTRKLKRKAQFIIDNNESVENLYAEVDKIINILRKK